MVSDRKQFNAARDIPSLDGKVILVTGGNAGIGKQSALDLSKHNPSQVWIAGRSAGSGQAAVTEIKNGAPEVLVHFLELDLSSFDSVKKAVEKFLAEAPRLDILMLNAGIMGGPAATTKEGYEIRFGTNHLGHALLFKLLTPLLEKTALDPTSDVRVVSLSSAGYAYSLPAGIEFETLKSKQEGISTSTKYCQSKLANLLYPQEIAKRYPQFTAVSVNPGEVKTNLFSAPAGPLMAVLKRLYLPWAGASVEEGAKNQLWAATSREVVSGEFYFPVGVAGKGTGQAKNKELARKLWEWTEKELEGHNL
jgi:retinol dehydrogenase-12